MSVGTTIYAGGEDTSITFTGAVTVVQGGNVYRTAWCREALNVPGSTSDPPTDLIIFPQFASVSLIWIHGRFAWAALGGGVTTDATMLRVLDSGGTARIVVRGAASGAIKVDKRDAGGVFTNLFTSATGVVPTAGFEPFPFDMKLDYSTTGSVTLWLNDINVGSFSGDVTTDGVMAVAQVECSSIDTAANLNWSECFGSDSITINAGLFTLPPLAAGVTQNWSGVVADIDKAVIDDTSFISDGTANDLSGWTTPVTFPTGAWLIQSIVQEARVAVGLSGPQHFDWYARTADGSDNLGGTSNAPGTLFSNFNNFIWAENPHTSVPWVVGDIVAGFNLGVKSLA